MKKSKTALTFASLLLAGGTFGLAGCDNDSIEELYGPPPEYSSGPSYNNDDLQVLYGPPPDGVYGDEDDEEMLDAFASEDSSSESPATDQAEDPSSSGDESQE